MIRHSRYGYCSILLAALLVCGCSQSTTHGTVHGTVTLDGKPVSNAVVRFVPVDGSSQTASANVSEGEYLLDVPIGLNRVEFSAPKIVGKQKMYDTEDSPEVDVVTELIPERYNIRSELQINVTTGKSHHTHDLKIE